MYKAPLIHLRSTLSGGSDPVLIVGSFRQQSETRQLILRMTIYNATHVDIAGLAYSFVLLLTVVYPLLLRVPSP